MIGGLQGSASVVLRVLVFNAVPSYLIIEEENEQSEGTERVFKCILHLNKCSSSFNHGRTAQKTEGTQFV